MHINNRLKSFVLKPPRSRRVTLSALIPTIAGAVFSIAHAGTADFELLPLAPNSAYFGADNAGGFSSGGLFFPNSYGEFPGGFFWGGFGYSNKTDTATPGLPNQFSAIPGAGAGGSSNYGIAFPGNFPPAVVEIPVGATVQSIAITNTTYAYLSMRDGDAFARKFGGISGNDDDFFLLTITGKDAGNATIGSVNFYLADYRFANNANDYLVNSWQTIDLSSIASARSLSFSLSSSDNGAFGMNTPSYFAFDNLMVLPEPGGALAAFVCGVAILRRRRKE